MAGLGTGWAETYILVLIAKRFDIDGLDLVMPGPDDFAAGIHAGHRLLSPNLDHHRALIKAKRHTATSTLSSSPTQAMQSNHS